MYKLMMCENLQIGLQLPADRKIGLLFASRLARRTKKTKCCFYIVKWYTDELTNEWKVS